MDGGHTDCRGQVRFPRAGAADQNQVVRRFHKCRRSQLFQQRLRERRLVPVDAEQVAVDGEAGRFELVAQALELPVGLLGGEHAFEPEFRPVGLFGLFGLQFIPGGGHAIEMQGLQLIQ